MSDLGRLGREATATSHMLAAMLWAEEHGDDHPLVRSFVMAHLAPLTLDDTESIRGALRMLCREIATELKAQGLEDEFRAEVFGLSSLAPI